MNLKGKTIGYALTGSFCTLEAAVTQLERIAAAGADVIPIISYTVNDMDTRFGKADVLKDRLVRITGNQIIKTVSQAEPIGPKGLLDLLAVCPCTGNSLAKIATGISDTPVTMAVKAHLRNDRPVVIAVSTNDGLSGNAQNIGKLLNTKNIYFVPFGQDDPVGKKTSLIAKNELLDKTLALALEKIQLQPILQ